MATLLLGCVPEFDEEWLVKDLRILGIRAEPPEIPVEPGKPPHIAVDALVVNPAAPADRLYAWELWACTPDEKLCDGAEMQTLLRKDRTPLAEISHGFQLSDRLRQAALDLFAKWRDRMQRFPLKLELRVHQEAGPVVRGVKQVYLTTESETNENPALEPIEVDGRALTDPIAVSCRPPAPLLGLTVKTAPPPEGEAIFEGPMQSLDVYVSRRWFNVSGGAFFRVEWSPCPGADDLQTGDIATLWVVLRDGRGGIDWQTVRADTSR